MISFKAKEIPEGLKKLDKSPRGRPVKKFGNMYRELDKGRWEPIYFIKN